MEREKKEIMYKGRYDILPIIHSTRKERKLENKEKKKKERR